MVRMAILAGTAAVSLVPGSGPALAHESSPAAQSKVDGRAVVADVRKILSANYVLPAVRPKLDAALAQGSSTGRYDVGDPAVLADRINEDMAAVAHDKHLGIMFSPEQSRDLAAHPQAGDDDGPPTPEQIRQADRLNHGILEMKVLPGNIRYINTIGFVWAGAKTAAVYDNAMRFLSGGDAAIIDLRQNGGGSPEAVRYMISHFVPADRQLVTFYMGGKAGDTWKSLGDLPAGRMVGKPLYVLTSGMTASAAEEFTGHVNGYKLGEIIGANTAGAGFRNSFFPVTGGYVISVSVGRAVLASTGKDWEGVGIAPTTKVDQGKALDVAQVHALRALAVNATGEDKKMYQSAATVLDAQVNPVATALPIAQYAGVYGERHITTEDGKIMFQREGGMKHVMVAVAPNEFAFTDAPTDRVRFNFAGGAVTGLELIRGDGSRTVAARNP